MTINGHHAANFERHIERFHHAEYEELQKQKSLKQPPTKKGKFEEERTSPRPTQPTLKQTKINVIKKTISVNMTEETVVETVLRALIVVCW